MRRPLAGPDRLRAEIVLAAAAGRANSRIAGELGVCTDTVRNWRRRFAGDRLLGLKDARRSGRPPVFTDTARAEAVALACALPAETGVPLSRWSCPELVRELAGRCQVAASASTVRRWLARDALKPWQHRSWISVRDPDFAVKAARVLDLYAGMWDGGPWARTTSSSARMRRPRSRPAAVATPSCPRARPARCASSTTTNAAAPWPTWPPGTSTADR